MLATSSLSGSLGTLRAARNLTERALATPEEGRPESIAVACLVCGHVCTGVGEDRIKAGRCPKDYIYWIRNGNDRVYERIEGGAA